jgi:hypothetical protein
MMVANCYSPRRAARAAMPFRCHLSKEYAIGTDHAIPGERPPIGGITANGTELAPPINGAVGPTTTPRFKTGGSRPGNSYGESR